MITENLSTLKIHSLTKEQYERELEAGRIDENALYLTPYEETDLSEYATQEYVDAQIAAIPTPDVSGQINTHNSSADAHSDIRALIGEKVYTQPEEPDNAPVGALWVDTDEESSSGGSGLPDIEEAQEGSFLKVVNGEPTWVNIPKTTETYKTTLLVTNWSQYAPFEQVSQVVGLLSTDYPFVDVDLSEVEDAQGIIEGWGLIGRVTVNSDDSIIAYCYGEKPVVDIPIVFKVVR